MRRKILIVDDDKEIRKLVEIYLRNEGFDTITASDGIEAIEKLQDNEIDMVVLDIMMPRMDGIQTCMKIRETNHIPILMLSAKTEDMDKILGLTSGADDYLAKPFNPLELVARVKSQFRRQDMFKTEKRKDESLIAIHDLEIHVDSHEVYVGTKKVKLTPTEFDIFEVPCSKMKGIVMKNRKKYTNTFGKKLIMNLKTRLWFIFESFVKKLKKIRVILCTLKPCGE